MNFVISSRTKSTIGKQASDLAQSLLAMMRPDGSDDAKREKLLAMLIRRGVPERVAVHTVLTLIR
jgi:hypothetical protein